MAEENHGLHIDLDWKKQAQEEKRRLEEEERQRAEQRAASAAAPVAPAGVVPPAAGASASAARGQRGGAGGARGQRELPPASVASLAQSLVTQTLYYLSEQAARTGDEVSNMDMAKHLIDTMDVLEAKTQGNLLPEEQQYLDTALYEARMRFIAVATQVIAGA